MKMEGVSPPRPLTHDFACAAIDALGGSLEGVVIDKVEGDCFHAKVIIRTEKQEKIVDCRPSDAMAMALRAGAPILADEEVLNRVGFVVELPSESPEPLPEEMPDEQQSSKEGP